MVKWGNKYQAIGKLWIDKWQRVIRFLNFRRRCAEMKQKTLPVLGALGAQGSQADTDRLAKAVPKENTKALTAQGCRKLSVTSLVAAFLMLASTSNVVGAQSASNAGVDQLNHPGSDAFQTAFDYVTT